MIPPIGRRRQSGTGAAGTSGPASSALGAIQLGTSDGESAAAAGAGCGPAAPGVSPARGASGARGACAAGGASGIGRSTGIDSVPIGPSDAPWITTEPRISPQFEQLMPDSSLAVEQRAHFQPAMVRVPSLRCHLRWWQDEVNPSGPDHPADLSARNCGLRG